jgi:hypothetical protein
MIGYDMLPGFESRDEVRLGSQEYSDRLVAVAAPVNTASVKAASLFAVDITLQFG